MSLCLLVLSEWGEEHNLMIQKQEKQCFQTGCRMSVLRQVLNLFSYSCLSLAAIADFWHSHLKSSPPGCCRPESKHYKEIKYECEKLAGMALPSQWDFLHSKTHLTDRKSLW